MHDKMSLKANGILSKNPSQALTLSFVDYDLNDLDFIINEYNADLGGIINGNATLRNVFNELNITSNLYVKDFELNNDKVGDAVVKTGWNKQKKAIELSGQVIAKGNVGADTTMSVNGFLYPNSETNQLDIGMAFKNFRVQALKYYLSFFSSDIHGTASGKLKLTGMLDKPVLVGKLNAYNTMMKIDYLNTYYAFADEIILKEDRILIDSVIIHDNNGPASIGKTGLCYGAILHDNLRNWRIDITLETPSLTCMNTSLAMNEYFYGRGVAGGVLRITGPDEDVRIEVRAKTDKGTTFNIPLTYPEDVSQIDFIQFVDKDFKTVGKVQSRDVELWGMTMDIDLEVTPDAQVQLIFDEKIGDVIRGHGNGNLSMELDARGVFQMFGSYEIEKGEYLYTLQNVVNKSFTVKPGGVIRWTGDPYEGELDLEASYLVHTSLSSLGLGLDTSRRRVPVECRLYLTGNFNHPNIERSIEFPGMNTFEAELYKAAIAPNLNYQFLALLVMNSFLYAGTERQGIGTFAGSALGTGYSEFISSQVSNWLSQLSNDFDIGVNYRPQDDLSAEQIQVILSTQLFNDRLSIDGNFDMGGDKQANAIQGSRNTSNIVGDVNIEYKITPEGKFKVKAFNKSNYRDILSYKAPYTQGVGVFYRKEFDSWKDLFKKRDKTP